MCNEDAATFPEDGRRGGVLRGLFQKNFRDSFYIFERMFTARPIPERRKRDPAPLSMPVRAARSGGLSRLPELFTNLFRKYFKTAR